MINTIPAWWHLASVKGKMYQRNTHCMAGGGSKTRPWAQIPWSSSKIKEKETQIHIVAEKMAIYLDCI
jgi:hypothetical protein